MPTFTTIALENLLEYRNSSSSSKISNSSTLNLTQEENDEQKSKSTATAAAAAAAARKRLNHIYISPALYTTPEPTPILDYSSSGSTSPSPYVFNRKGRGGGGGKSANQRIDGFEVQFTDADAVEVTSGAENENSLVIQDVDPDDVEDDVFVDPRCDSLSVVSSSELNDSGRLLGFENMSLVSNQIGEFYDAIEDFSSDGSILGVASCSRNLESELHTTRLSLLEEIEKCKAAEDHLATMCTHWQRVGKVLLSQTGLAPSYDGFDINTVKQFSEEVIVARFVAEAMGKAEAQGEAELAAELIIGSKDKEISRLRDRMQYYEAMIHEMSQKNLESMEVARRRRDRKRWQRKWLWSCIGISIVIGASVIVYSYAPPQTLQIDAVCDRQPDVGYD